MTSGDEQTPAAALVDERAYEPPALTALGSVDELTQGLDGSTVKPPPP